MLVLIGILLPPLGAVLRPYVTEAVIGLLCIAFMRVDVQAFRSYLRRPGLVLVASVWTSIGVPALFAIGCLLPDVNETSPDLFLGLMLQAVTSPMMAAPAFAALMGLDATLVLAVLIVSTAITPFSAPLISAAAGLELSLSPLWLGLKLFGILAGSALAGWALRRAFGATKISKFHDEVDGMNILLLFVFVSAVMGDVGIQFLENPLMVISLTFFAFVVFIMLLVITYFVFAKAGTKRAFALGMITSQRNMGLMLAGTGGVLPDLTWLYFAVSQFPIYLSPLLLQPIARMISAREKRIAPR